MKKRLQNTNHNFMGAVYGGASFTLWGFLPLYWKLLKQVPSIEILAHRVLWSFVFVILLILVFNMRDRLTATLRDKRRLIYLSLCACMISINWFTYIWAVNNNHLVESSMGYYINPLLAVLLGILVLKERLDRLQLLALGMATVGVLFMAVQNGKIPWVSLLLAVSFALYGLLKKMAAVESLIGLTLETAILTPAAAAFLLYNQVNGSGALFRGSLLTTLLLLGAGIVTATPLILFAKGANRVALSTIGFLQYISPTISLILGIFLYKEKFTAVHLISFGLIWAALMVYSLSQIPIGKRILQRALGKAESVN